MTEPRFFMDVVIACELVLLILLVGAGVVLLHRYVRAFQAEAADRRQYRAGTDALIAFVAPQLTKEPNGINQKRESA